MNTLNVKYIYIGLIFNFFLGNSFVSLAQNDYQTNMQSLKLEFEASTTKDEFIKLGNKYNRIAVVEKDKWLPKYYEILCTIAWAFEEEEAQMKEKLAQKIEEMISTTENKFGTQEELEVLKGRFLQLQMGLDTTNQLEGALTLFETIEESVKKYPKNPRVLLLMGQIILFSPKNFMGYTNNDGLVYVEKAALLLKEVKHEDTIEPTWGYKESLSYLKRYKNKSTVDSKVENNISELNSNTIEVKDGVVSELLEAFNGNTTLDYDKVECQLENLIDQYPNNALLYYYRAFCMTQLALETRNISTVDQYCDIANQVIEASPDGLAKDELYCLQALIKSARIRVDYNKRGLKFYLQSNELLNQALDLNPNNPRVYFLKGQNQRNLPQEFGGGMDGAKKYFLKSKELFETQAVDLPIKWGKTQVDKIVSKF